jgi:hypothetical protein
MICLFHVKLFWRGTLPQVDRYRCTSTDKLSVLYSVPVALYCMKNGDEMTRVGRRSSVMRVKPACLMPTKEKVEHIYPVSGCNVEVQDFHHSTIYSKDLGCFGTFLFSLMLVKRDQPSTQSFCHLCESCCSQLKFSNLVMLQYGIATMPWSAVTDSLRRLLQHIIHTAPPREMHNSIYWFREGSTFFEKMAHEVSFHAQVLFCWDAEQCLCG